MVEADSAAEPTAYADRSVRLRLFGLLALGMGAACGALAVLQLALALVPLGLSADDSGQQELTVSLMSASTLLLIGFAFAAVGVGSILRRRWVRPMMLTLAWTWLLGGVMALVVMPGLLGAATEMMTETVSQEALAVTRAVLMGLIALVGVALPGLFVLVYRDEDLARTCEAHDRAESWTERCPPAVLGLSVVLAACGALALPMALRPAVPVFGWLFTGWPAALILLAGGGISIWLARSTYLLEPAGWWATLGLLLAIGVSTGVSFAVVEPAAYYRALGYPEWQAEILGRSGATSGPLGVGMAVLLTVVSVVYMLRIRKHFLPTAVG